MRSSQSGLKTLRINAAVLQFQVYCEPVTTQYENYIGSESKHATLSERCNKYYEKSLANQKTASA